MSAVASELRIGRTTIGDGLFRLGYPSGIGPCPCTPLCCTGGVHVDIPERDRILAYVPIARRHTDAAQRTDRNTWCERSEVPDWDVPPGRCVSTGEQGGKCTFLDGDMHSTLQVAGPKGTGRWALMPNFCKVTPITVGVVRFDGLVQDERGCCPPGISFGTPAYSGELLHLLGAEGDGCPGQHNTMHPVRTASS